MVLNLGEENHGGGGGRRDGHTPPPYNTDMEYKDGDNKQLNGDTDSVKNSESSEQPLDFSVKRTPSKSSDDLRLPRLSPIPPHVTSLSDNDVVRRHSSGEHDLRRMRQQRSTYNDKIGEPKVAPPGLLPITSLNSPNFGIPPRLPTGFPPHLAKLGALAPLIIDPSATNQRNVEQQQNGKSPSRPFKAFPKDPMSLPLGYFGMPGMPALPGLDKIPPTLSQEEMFKRYRDYFLKLQQQNESHQRNTAINSPAVTSTVPRDHNDEHDQPPSPPPQTYQYSPVSSPQSTANLSPDSNSSSGYQQQQFNTTDDKDFKFNAANFNSSNTLNGLSSRKRARLLPEECKDASYWERRRKNNEAAKRSRDARRAKEDEIALRAAFLEQENLRLRLELASLKTETAKLKDMLYSS